MWPYRSRLKLFLIFYYHLFDRSLKSTTGLPWKGPLSLVTRAFKGEDWRCSVACHLFVRCPLPFFLLDYKFSVYKKESQINYKQYSSKMTHWYSNFRVFIFLFFCFLPFTSNRRCPLGAIFQRSWISRKIINVKCHFFGFEKLEWILTYTLN
jgi:hypothetical protein